MARVTWRGVTVDQRTANMLDEVARLSGRIYVRPTQGSFRGGRTAASAGTHDGCGAVDIITGTPADMAALVPIMRRVGFAAWHRTPAQSNWPHHVHAIAVQPGGKYDRGCLSPGAASQVVDYYEGRNGLASRAADDGPRNHVGVRWETYLARHRVREWDEMASKAEVRDAVRDAIRAELLGHNDPVTKTARTVDTMYERQRKMEDRQKRIDKRTERIDKSMGTAFARLRKIYRKIIEGPAGHAIGEKWRPEDDPRDPGY